MSKFFNNKYLLLLFRIILGFVFIYAATSKATDPESFARAISNYKLLPIFLINIFAVTLPWIELGCGLLLVFGISVKENSAILSTLLLIFIIAIVVSLARGLNIDCGCFGTVGGAKVGIQKLLENFGLLIMGFVLVKFDSKFLSLIEQSS